MSLSIYEFTENQKIAFNRFSKLKVGAIFLDCGEGKTLLAHELVRHNKEKIDFCLWLCPKSIMKNTYDEFCNFKKIEGVDFKFFGWETLSNSDAKTLDLIDLCKNKRIFIVADESLFIKNYNKRLLALSRIKSEFRLILNGTPIVRDVFDIFNQINFLHPKIINMNDNQFRSTFFDEIKFKKKGCSEKIFYKENKINVEQLYKLIEPYVITSKFLFEKNEVEDVFYVNPTIETFEKSKKITADMLEKIETYNINSTTIISTLSKLSMVSSIDRNKIELVSNYIKDKRIIVYCCFIQESEEISNLSGGYLINGNITKKERDLTIEKFKTGSKPLVMTLGTGAFGLNLQFCNEIVFSSVSFNFGHVEQAKRRIKRIGQNSDIKYTFFDVDMKINRLINNNLFFKKQNLDFLVEAIRNGKDLL
jgi:SNF2 family DNA or RNA helicase